MNLLSANSTARFVEPRGFDYYWVPANLHVIHIDYPYDFVLYAFMFIGFWWIIYNACIYGLWMVHWLIDWLF
jgi:hypothetical protein